MDSIIAGRFETRAIAESVAAVLHGYVDSDDICIFHSNPPGQHDVSPQVGNENEDPGAEDAEQSSAGGAIAGALAGGAIGAFGGPLIALAGAGVGALTGSVVGAMSGLGDHADGPGLANRRPGGVMLSVRIASPANQQRVIDTLRREGAADVERAQGKWIDGDWTDFDPVAAPQLVDTEPN